MNKNTDIETIRLPPTIKALLRQGLGKTGPDGSSVWPKSGYIDWLDVNIREKVNLMFKSYMVGMSASELVALAESVEQEAAKPKDREGSPGRASAWFIPFPQDYEAPDWDWDGGGGDWSA